MKKVVVIDIETTGLDENKDRIWQVAWVEAVEADGRLVVEKLQEMIFNTEDKKYVSVINNVIANADKVVAHNIRFEEKFLLVAGVSVISEKEKYCTMISSTNLCKIKRYTKSGEYYYKYPRLEEAVMILLGDLSESNFHDASVDVFWTAKLYAKINGFVFDDSNLKIKKARRIIKTYYQFKYDYRFGSERNRYGTDNLFVYHIKSKADKARLELAWWKSSIKRFFFEKIFKRDTADDDIPF